MRKSVRRMLIAIWASALIILCALGIYLFRELLHSSPPVVDRMVEQTAPLPARTMNVTLYFGGTGGRGLGSEQRQIQVGQRGVHELVRLVLAEVISGPASALVRSVPRETTINNVFILDNGELVIDFGKEIQAHHPGGSFSELITVYSIVNTITENFEEISSVRFLVEGGEIETLVGHVDLSEPVMPDQTWIDGAKGPVK